LVLLSQVIAIKFCLKVITFVFTVKSFLELVRYIFTIPGVKMFLSERLSQDPLENFFGCQRQRRGAHENPNMSEFCKNTNALRVINSVCGDVTKGNCRGNKQALDVQIESRPLRKRCRTKGGKRACFSKLIKPPTVFKHKPKFQAPNRKLKRVQRSAVTKSKTHKLAIGSKRKQRSVIKPTVIPKKNAVLPSPAAATPQEVVAEPLSDISDIEMIVEECTEISEEICKSPLTACLVSTDPDQYDNHQVDHRKSELFNKIFVPSDLQMISNVLAPGPPEDVLSMCGSIYLKRCDLQTLDDFKWLNDQVSIMAELLFVITFFYSGYQCIFEADISCL